MRRRWAKADNSALYLQRHSHSTLHTASARVRLAQRIPALAAPLLRCTCWLTFLLLVSFVLHCQIPAVPLHVRDRHIGSVRCHHRAQCGADLRI